MTAASSSASRLRTVESLWRSAREKLVRTCGDVESNPQEAFRNYSEVLEEEKRQLTDLAMVTTANLTDDDIDTAVKARLKEHVDTRSKIVDEALASIAKGNGVITAGQKYAAQIRSKLPSDYRTPPFLSRSAAHTTHWRPFHGDIEKRCEAINAWGGEVQLQTFEHADGESGAEGERHQRILALVSTPFSLREAQWNYMLTEADIAYGMRLPPNTLKLAANLLTRLAENERGADNDKVPAEYKLAYHNPSLHSLRTVAMLSALFHRAEWEYLKNDKFRQLTPDNQDELLTAMRKVQSRMMLATLLHDCGEIEGEIGWATDRQKFKGYPEKLAAYEEKVAAIEAQAFERRLNRALNALEADGAISSDDKIGLAQEFRSHQRMTDEGATFEGRLIKTIEHIETSLDILRYKEFEKRELSSEDKKYSLEYVAKAFWDNPYEEEVPGQKNLASFIPRDANGQEVDEVHQAVYTALYNATRDLYIDTQDKLIDAYVPHGGRETAHSWLHRVHESRTPSVSAARE